MDPGFRRVTGRGGMRQGSMTTQDGEPAPGGAAPAGGRRRRLGLRLVLTLLVVVTVAVTALLIHLTWSYTAYRNVRDVVGQLNAQIVDSVHRELRRTFDE